jgi:hypothetical protein
MYSSDNKTYFTLLFVGSYNLADTCRRLEGTFWRHRTPSQLSPHFRWRLAFCLHPDNRKNRGEGWVRPSGQHSKMNTLRERIRFSGPNKLQTVKTIYFKFRNSWQGGHCDRPPAGRHYRADNTTTVQHYNSTTLQQYSTTTVQHYNSTTLQQYNTTTVQNYNSTTLQQYNTTTVQYYNSTTLQQYKTTTVKHYNSTTLQQYNTTTVQNYNSTTLQQYKTTTLQQYNTTTVQQ